MYIVSLNEMLYNNYPDDILNLMRFAIFESLGTYTANAISDEMMDKGQVDVRGLQINTNTDLAALVRAFRDKRYETFRILYCKDGRIVGNDNVTSKLVDSTPFIKRFNHSDNAIEEEHKAFYYYKAKAQRLNADKIFILHNHPANSAKFSNEDRRITTVFLNELGDLYGGHFLILDDSILYIYGPKDTEVIIPNLIDKSKPSIDNELLGYQILNRIDKIELANKLANDDYATVVYLDSTCSVVAIEEVENNKFNNKSVFKYFKNELSNNGAIYVIVITSNEELMDYLMCKESRDTFIDIILFNDGEITTLRDFLRRR